MMNKLDTDIFDNEIAALRAMIGNLEEDGQKSKIKITAPVPSPSSNSLSSKDLILIKQIMEKFP